MQKFARRLLITLIFFMNSNVFAQEVYTISGRVSDDKDHPIKDATIFISGSQKITATDVDGKFTFGRITAGNYIISTKMLGYGAPSQAVTVHDKSVNIAIKLKVRPIILNEVKIGTDDNWEKNYSIFKDQFLGTSINAKNCIISNPEIIRFSSQKIDADHIVLKADADDLLIIENKLLGYRIKYLLKTFEYNSKTQLTFYDGDSNFQELESTDEQKNIWEQNRLKVYKGSLMHFLRSVFANTVLDEGFITNQILKSSNLFDTQNYVNPSPVKFDRLVTTVDSSFISFKFTALNVDYNEKKAARLKKKKNSQNNLLTVDQISKSSQLLLHLKEALVDARGSVFTGYQTFLIRGNWAAKRIGDQLPFEYLPSKSAK